MSDFALNAPRQQRSAQSWERVLVAGAEILSERGYDGFTVSEVCRRADVTTGSIYARVPSKEALFHVIAEREIERIMREATDFRGGTANSGQTLEEFIPAIVTDFINEFERERGLLRAMLMESKLDEVIYGLGERVTSNAHGRFTTAFEPFISDIHNPEPELAVDLCFRLLSAMMVHRITAAFEWELHAASEEFAAEMSSVFRAYLLHGP